MLEQRIQQQFFDSADLQYQAAETLARPIADAVAAVVGCITAGGKVLTCGAGASAADAQGFAARFVGRFERERPGLPAIALGGNAALLAAVVDDDEPGQHYAKQVQALGMPGDVLLALVAQGSSASLRAAVAAAQAKDMSVVALTGRDGGALKDALGEADVLIAVPHDRAVRIQEVHALVLHCICDAVDLQLMGEQDNVA